MASLVGELGSRHVGPIVAAPGLWSTGLIVVANEPSCSAACVSLPDQGLNPRYPHWQMDFLPLDGLSTTEPPGKSSHLVFPLIFL